MRPTRPARARRDNPFVAWLVGPMALLGIGSAVALIKTGPSGLFAIFALSAVGLALLWILASSLWPARADRTCPMCGAEALRRMSKDSTHGLTCKACGFSDETASSFLLAEEEGPLERVVLKERRSRVES